MRAFRRLTALIGAVVAVLVAVLVVAWLAAPAAAAPAGQFLIVSDIHFDPMAEPRLVDRLAGAAPAQWPAIFNGGAGSLGRYGRDTTWPLLRSGLRAMRTALPQPDFVLIPGDFLAHHFRRSFDAAATRHGDADYRGFVRKTMQFLAQQLRDSFPGAPILLALGNNDADCGDYRLQPSGPFLADMLPIARGLARGAVRPGFARDWAEYGNYAAALPGLPRLRVVLLDDVFFSPHYRDGCGAAASGNPAKATLDWLGGELERARRAGERVWLVLHIPPGIDPYSTQRLACPGRVVTMWDPAYAAPFAALLRRYRDVVAATLAGHTHMDDFRLLGDDGFVLITPALSPIFGQNPAFRTVAYDAAGGLLDATTWDLADLSSAAPPPHWELEYSFGAAWQLPRIDRAGLARLDAAIAASPASRARWQQFYAASSPVFWPLNAGFGEDRAIRAARCAEEQVGVGGFRRCYCGD